jgi:NAD(P)-dependent dehydrogenase (short-subunit alcohol dehydrogenase family)
MDSESGRINLTDFTPVIRGLLAKDTDSEDVPYESVILKTLAGDEAVRFAGSAENADREKWPEPLVKSEERSLFLDAADYAGDAEKARERLSGRISDYSKQFGHKPDVICLRGMGVLYVDRGDDGSDLPLRNKVALITGAAGAIGYGICRGLLENGCYLAATDLAGDRLDSLGAELKQTAGERIIATALDVTDKDSVSEGFRNVIQTWGGIDIVVVNAGIATASYLKDMDFDTFCRLQKVNVEGALLTLQESARHFIRQGTGGDIIVISSKAVPAPGAGFGAYSATKAACHQLGRIASLELAQYGVRVNMVAPDAVFSEGTHKSGLWEEIGPGRMQARGLDEEQLHEYYRNRNLLKARVTGRHVSNAVLFFATRKTPTTGATIPVDGGLPDATLR